jgi:hypothetical protein
MKKILLGTKQAETLEDCMTLAINFLEGMEEYKDDYKRFSELRERIETQLNN